MNVLLRRVATRYPDEITAYSVLVDGQGVGTVTQVYSGGYRSRGHKNPYYKWVEERAWTYSPYNLCREQVATRKEAVGSLLGALKERRGDL